MKANCYHGLDLDKIEISKDGLSLRYVYKCKQPECGERLFCIRPNSWHRKPSAGHCPLCGSPRVLIWRYKVPDDSMSEWAEISESCITWFEGCSGYPKCTWKPTIIKTKPYYRSNRKTGFSPDWDEQEGPDYADLC